MTSWKDQKIYSKYPSTTRDISFWAVSKTKEQVLVFLEVIQSFYSILVRYYIVDVFTNNESITSYTCRFVFLSKERTLTNKEVNEVVDDITKRMSDVELVVK